MLNSLFLIFIANFNLAIKKWCYVNLVALKIVNNLQIRIVIPEEEFAYFKLIVYSNLL